MERPGTVDGQINPEGGRVTCMWLNALNVNPLPTLLAWDDPALLRFVRRDLLEEPVAPSETL